LPTNALSGREKEAVPANAARDENAGAKEEERESGREEFPEPTVCESQEQGKAEANEEGKYGDVAMLEQADARVIVGHS
jgi:hypothetical protein